MIVNRDKATFYLLCLLTPFENTSLASIGGVFTAPLAIITMPLIIWCLSSKISRLRDYEFRIAKFFFIIFTISFLNLIYLQTKYDFSFLVDRGFRFFLISAPTFIVFVFCARIDKKTFNTGILILTCIVLVSYLINIVSPEIVNNKSFIQYSTAFSSNRMRGFTLEASTFAFQLIACALIFFKSRNLNLFIAIPILIALILPTTSKGGIVTLLLASTITFLIFSIRINPIFKYLSLPIILLLLVATNIDFLSSIFSSDIEKYNSVATRSTIILTGFVSFFNFPLGSGFFGYLPSIYENGPIARNIIDSLFPRVLNFSEVNSYFIVGEVEGVGTKTFTLDWIIYGGIIFIYYYFIFIRHFLKICISNRNFYDLLIFLFLLISISTYIPADGRYIAPLVLAYLTTSLNYSVSDKEKNAV